MASFAQRIVPPRTFESYTPIELALRAATLDTPQWEAAFVPVAGNKDRLETLFHQYINKNFPLARADVPPLEAFVLANRPAEIPSSEESYGLWHAHHPYGQRFESYPAMNSECDLPTSFPLLRLK